MKYIEVDIKMNDTGVFRDMLIDTLGNEGPYESFVETDGGLRAYVPADQYDEAFLQATAQAFPIPMQYVATPMEDKDWNEEWERNHEAVLVRSERGTVWVRAPFHPRRTDVDYEIIIEPKMSFGTAHHPTTYMMLCYVAECEVAQRRVLDMGSGTAILSILARMRGASYVEAIDIDDWAYRNALENAETNGVEIDCRVGDAALLKDASPFDIIIANINRNILMRDMEHYARVLRAGGRLMMSGFYEADEGAIIGRANELGMSLVSKKTREGWCALEVQMS